ncbi:MAG: hypothetical protein IPH20_24755 [Bacteroidales bacterium]|nr:hypothetical protein [Bacteroidales bacterium]
MKGLVAFLFLTLILTFGCNKDEFPDEFSIIGPWVETTSNAGKVEIEFKSGNRAYLKTVSTEPFDTLMYRLEKKDELQLFEPEEYPNGIRTTHKLGYSQNKEELTIYSLFPSLPEAQSKTVFKRK